MTKKEVLKLLLKLLEDCWVIVDHKDEGPDYAVDYDFLIKNIKEELTLKS